MSEPLFGSHGIANIIQGLRPDADVPTGSREWPPKFPFEATKKEDQESMREWVNRVRGSGANLIEPEENIMLWGYFTWNNNYYEKISIQAVVAVAEGREVTIDNYLLDDCEGHYLRLDLHPKALGEIFIEPSPHIHIVTDGKPRFAAVSSPEEDPVLAFLEFICRNYQHTKWISWVESLYVQDIEERIESFDSIKSYFLASELKQLQRPPVAAEVKKIKDSIMSARAKERMLQISPTLWNIAGSF